jgi:hypothetical protein
MEKKPQDWREFLFRTLRESVKSMDEILRMGKDVPALPGSTNNASLKGVACALGSRTEVLIPSLKYSDGQGLSCRARARHALQEWLRPSKRAIARGSRTEVLIPAGGCYCTAILSDGQGFEPWGSTQANVCLGETMGKSFDETGDLRPIRPEGVYRRLKNFQLTPPQ